MDDEENWTLKKTEKARQLGKKKGMPGPRGTLLARQSECLRAEGVPSCTICKLVLASTKKRISKKSGTSGFTYT